MTPSPATSLESALARAADRYGTALLFEPERLRLELDLACPDAPGDVAQILAGLAEGVPISLLAAHGEAELDIVLREQVDRLVARADLDRTRATWVVRTWALALALPTTGIDGPIALPQHSTAAAPDFASVVTPLSASQRAQPVPPAIVIPAVADKPPSPSSSAPPAGRRPEEVVRAEPLPHPDASLRPAQAPDATTGTATPSQAPVEPAAVAAPVPRPVDASASPTEPPAPAVPPARRPLPVRPKPITSPAPPLAYLPPAASARRKQGWLAIASLVAVVAVVAAVTALRPGRDAPERAATTGAPVPGTSAAKTATPTPGPSVAATTAAPPPAEAVRSTPPPNAGSSQPTGATADVLPEGRSGNAAAGVVSPQDRTPGPAGIALAAPAPDAKAGGAQASSAPAESPVQLVAGSPAAPPRVVDPIALTAPTIARVGVPRVTAGQPFQVVVEVAPGSASVASIDRRVVSGNAGTAGEVTSTARLPRTASGALLLPFRAIADPGRVVVELALVGPGGAKGDPKAVEIRVAPASGSPAAQAACTRATCGSVAAVRDVEGSASGAARGYAVVVRMDDRTIESVVLPTRPRLGQRMRKVGNRFVTG